MSLKKPHFGEVFDYDGRWKIMYICPATAGPSGDWIGLLVWRQSGVIDSIDNIGEIAQRVPLVDSPYSHWIWIEADDA